MKQTEYALFLDDERIPAFLEGREHPTAIHHHQYPWVICRTQQDAQETIESRGRPALISFDNDLGEGAGSGIGLARWLEEEHKEGRIDCRGMRFQVHSRNNVEAPKIQKLLIELVDGSVPFGIGAGSAFGEIEY